MLHLLFAALVCEPSSRCLAALWACLLLTGTAATVCQAKKVGHAAALEGWSINVGLGQ